MAVDNETKARENRMRAAAQRQGLLLTKSRRRDPRALDYNTWTLVDLEDYDVVDELMTLDEVESHLFGEA